MAPTASKPDPDAIHVALTSAAVDLIALNLRPGDPLYGSRDFFIAQGLRLRGSHPVVKGHPTLFAPESASDDEIGAARNALEADRPNPDPFA